MAVRRPADSADFRSHEDIFSFNQSLDTSGDILEKPRSLGVGVANASRLNEKKKNKYIDMFFIIWSASFNTNSANLVAEIKEYFRRGSYSLSTPKRENRPGKVVPLPLSPHLICPLPVKRGRSTYPYVRTCLSKQCSPTRFGATAAND